MTKTFIVREIDTIIREGYIKAESLEQAEEIVNSEDYFEISFEITEEYVDDIEIEEEKDND
jgi:hypothetical protein